MFVLCVVCFIASLLGAVFGFLLADSNPTIGSNIEALYFPNNYYGSYYAELLEHEEELSALRDQVSVYFGVSIICALLVLLSFIYLCMAVGEKSADGKVTLKVVDRMYTEIQLLVIALSLGLGGAGFANILHYTFWRG